jgi:hypothetical protein
VAVFKKFRGFQARGGGIGLLLDCKLLETLSGARYVLGLFLLKASWTHQN